MNNKNVTHHAKHGVAAFGYECRKWGLLDHCALVKSLLSEIEARKYKIDNGLRCEMSKVVLDFHWNHWLPLREIYGLDTLLEAMSQGHPEMVCTYSPEIFIKLRGVCARLRSNIGYPSLRTQH